jgi:hypothetical protein
MVGFFLFRIGTSAGLLCTRQWTILFRISRLIVELLTSLEVLCCMEFACLLYVLVRRMAYSLCVVCCTGLCSHSAALQHVQSSAQPTSRCYRYKLCVISDYNCKCRPPHYNILSVFCEVEHTHAQTDDAPCQLNCSSAQDAVSKWRFGFGIVGILSLSLGKP